MSDLLSINVNQHTEKKGALTYLSWAWAWAEVLKIDPAAEWHVHFYGPEDRKSPAIWMPDGTAMVMTTVRIKDCSRACTLPVMDNRNNAVKNPDARKISDAIMRCMTKAIAMHGLGLYIYAGEDLPEGDESPRTEEEVQQRLSWIAEQKSLISNAKTAGELKKVMEEALATTDRMRDKDAEDQLREAALNKAKTAKPKSTEGATA